jgi:hypothetical protein
MSQEKNRSHHTPLVLLDPLGKSLVEDRDLCAVHVVLEAYERELNKVKEMSEVARGKTITKE